MVVGVVSVSICSSVGRSVGCRVLLLVVVLVVALVVEFYCWSHLHSSQKFPTSILTRTRTRALIYNPL